MPHRLRGDLLLVIVTLIAAAGWLFSKNALAVVPPFLFIAVRFLLAGCLLMLFSRRRLAQLSGLQWWSAIKTGLLFAVALLLWILGLFHSTHLGEAAFIASLAVIAIPVMGRVVYGHSISKTLLLPLLLAVLGLAALTLEGKVSFERSQLYLLLAAVFFALQFVVTASHAAKMPPLTLAAVQMMTVGIVAFIVALLTEPVAFNWSADIWGWVLASGLIASLLRFSLQTYALSLSTATHAGMLMVLEPVWVTIIGAYYLSETLALNQWLGCGLIFLAIIIYQLSQIKAWRYRGS
ncbi:DMT family transporter [Dasania sp. GY-MA-18]|uniref:DMT family transporter n=1 Tax=Dasania phycosphaerae TaxID=2950436 RepID=A0A9J6RIY3_9GAMM|nr:MULTISPECIES: DMT family transporter [Dasania]MCR8921731.1 DMT family transporter [Dasania sp. GY-MA-18]MCZ0864159.1 DMT family transporter [Dasania phycosphaerae]MCZ0867887.1 DMT family transporter [Dasania phycosphaerae]